VTRSLGGSLRSARSLCGQGSLVNESSHRSLQKPEVLRSIMTDGFFQRSFRSCDFPFQRCVLSVEPDIFPQRCAVFLQEPRLFTQR